MLDVFKHLSGNEIDQYWQQLKPLFQRCVDKAVHDEYDIDDIYLGAKAERFHIMAAFKDKAVHIAIVFEIVNYPSGKIACNVLALGGQYLNDLMCQFLATFKQWCHDADISWIECLASRGMERIFHRYGFQTIYRQLRLNTED